MPLDVATSSVTLTCVIYLSVMFYKYIHTGRSRGPPGSSRPPEYLDDRLQRDTEVGDRNVIASYS